MACFKPMKGYVGENGKLVFDKSKSVHGFKIAVPCRMCIGCRIDYSKEWAVRCVNEAQMHEDNMFVTLTYDDDHIPEDLQLNHEDWQQFIRAVRKKYRKYTKRDEDGNVIDYGIRYYMCGEYGEKTSRPHYHALIFNFKFPDMKHEGDRRGNRIWSSEQLTELWGKGHTEIGSVTFQSAAYCARYITKKIMGPDAKFGHPIVDSETGEIVDRRTPEYTKMSLKPGLGETWIEKYKSDVFPEDMVTIQGGRKVKAPKYYREWLKKNDPEMYERCREKRIDLAKRNADDSTEERLAVREEVLKRRTQNLHRKLS